MYCLCPYWLWEKSDISVCNRASSGKCYSGDSFEKTKRFCLFSLLSSQSKDQDHGNSKFFFTTAESLLEGKGCTVSDNALT